MLYYLSGRHFQGGGCLLNFELPSAVFFDVLQQVVEVEDFPSQEVHLL